MKKILTSLAITAAFALVPFTSASAHHDQCGDGRLVGYTPCGKPIYAYHEVVGHDRCGRNVWEWVTHYPSSCHCRDRHREGYYSRPPGYCEVPRSGGSWSFFFRF